MHLATLQSLNTSCYIQVHLDEDGLEIDEDQRRSFFQFTKIEPRLLPILPSHWSGESVEVRQDHCTTQCRLSFTYVWSCFHEYAFSNCH